MGHINIVTEQDVEEPYIVEGLPGVGLVGKIAADHIVEEFGMSLYAECECPGLPDVAVFDESSFSVKAPVRIYADEEKNMLVLQSDVPVSSRKAECFAGCLTEWFIDNDVTPLFLSGLPKQRESEDIPSLYGVATGGSGESLRDLGVDPPEKSGFISGPTGALINEARENSLNSVGLIADTDPRFPDPAASRVVIKQGIQPITGLEIDTEELVERSEEIMEARERLAKQMQESGDEESTRAAPVGMYQ